MSSSKKKFLAASFMDKTAQDSQKDEKSNLSDHQQIIEQVDVLTECGVCKVQLGQKKRACGVCNLNICNNHLRKKRKDKNNAWARICDDCEDKYLFEAYMKFELKAQEALKMHQQIIQLKNQQYQRQLTGKTLKINILKNQRQQSLKTHLQIKKKLTIISNDLQKKMKATQAQENICNQKQQLQDRLQAALPRPLEQDFQALKIQNEKITKQLVRIEKKINETIQILSLTQRQLNHAYQEWENRQNQKIKEQDKKNEKCSIQ